MSLVNYSINTRINISNQLFESDNHAQTTKGGDRSMKLREANCIMKEDNEQKFEEIANLCRWSDEQVTRKNQFKREVNWFVQFCAPSASITEPH